MTEANTYLPSRNGNDDAPGRAGNDDGDDGGADTGTLTKTRTKTKKPSMYKVLMMNDDYTPMDFVIYILQNCFRMTIAEATEVMLHVHHKGVGICGIFPLDVAETKVAQVMAVAQKNEHPLQCTLEKE